MRRYGIKVWSRDVLKNPAFFQQCVQAVKEGIFGYIELFPLAESYPETSGAIRKASSGLPVVIHAPHALFDMDTGHAEKLLQNQKIMEDSFRFADLLNAELIVTHPGTGEGTEYLQESIRQFQAFNDKRIAVENMPCQCSVTGRILHGTTPEEVAQIIKETGCKFCLDFSHAICAANHHGLNAYDELDKFKQLQPDMFHLSDGEFASEIDSHRHFGEGDFDLFRLVREYTGDGSLITMETGHGIPSGIEPWLQDIAFIKKFS